MQDTLATEPPTTNENVTIEVAPSHLVGSREARQLLGRRDLSRRRKRRAFITLVQILEMHCLALEKQVRDLGGEPVKPAVGKRS